MLPILNPTIDAMEPATTEATNTSALNPIARPQPVYDALRPRAPRLALSFRWRETGPRGLGNRRRVHRTAVDHQVRVGHRERRLADDEDARGRLHRDRDANVGDARV